MPAPHGFVEKLAELSRAGAPFVSATLVDAVGSTPQDAGTKMLVDQNGLVFGTVGGGRIENKSIEHAQKMLTTGTMATELTEWNLQRDVGMTCGGVVKLFFEAYNLRTWEIVVFGAGHVAQALVPVLLSLDCRITCIDPRSEWLNRFPDSNKLVALKLERPQDHVRKLPNDAYVLCMTMGHRTDRPILEEVFKQNRSFPYLGVIGSAAKRKVIVRELVASGIAEQVAESFRCPMGLDLGSNQPGEIAISIAAELIQTRDQLVVGTTE